MYYRKLAAPKTTFTFLFNKDSIPIHLAAAANPLNVQWLMYVVCLLHVVSQENEIKALSAEIEHLKNPAALGVPNQIEELREENAKLKYRLNILKRVSSA